jgi:hypothetical protein
MSVNNFIPELWSGRINSVLQKSLVFGSVCNRDYEGEFSQGGDIVRINTIGKPTVGTYTKNSTTVTPEILQDSQSTLLLDKSDYFAFVVDDIDKAQTKGGVMAEGMNNAAYALRDKADTNIGLLYSQAGTTVSTTAITSLNVYEMFLSAAQALSQYNVPREGRWAVVPPWIITKMALAKLFTENTSNTALDNGFVARYAGFDVKESNNVYNDGTTYYPMFGTTKAISFVDQINSVEAYRPEGKFADAVKGLHVYGCKVVYPEALVVQTATIGAEA